MLPRRRVATAIAEPMHAEPMHHWDGTTHVSMAGLTQLASQVSDTAGEVFTYDLESCVRHGDALTPSPKAPAHP